MPRRGCATRTPARCSARRARASGASLGELLVKAAARYRRRPRRGATGSSRAARRPRRAASTRSSWRPGPRSPGDPEPARGGHEVVSEESPVEILTDDLAALQRRIARRSFLGRAGGSLGSRPCCRSSTRRRSAARRPGPTGPPPGPASSGRCTSRRRPSGSSTSTWPAGRRTSRRFDYKPKLAEAARPADARVVHQGPADRPAPGPSSSCFAPQHPFARYGESGQEICDALPADRRRSPTTSASSARCRPSRSTTTRRTRS